MTRTQILAAGRSVLADLLSRHMSAGTPYALLDHPSHGNVGDSAIWCGERVLLEELTGRPPDYTCNLRSFDVDELRHACPEGPVLLHGGGNLGDVWPTHQDFRENVITRLGMRRIVQLPQSMHFAEPRRRERFARVLDAHGDVHLLLRDEDSVAAAASLPASASLAPDAAVALGPQDRPVTPTLDVLVLLRTDHESVRTTTPDLRGPFEVTDWLEEDERAVARQQRRADLQALLALSPGRLSRRRRRFDAVAWGRVARGFRLLARGRTVITDRLHAHLLCVLLDLPHVVLDNSYGKVHRYVRTWHEGLKLVTTATSWREVSRLVEPGAGR